MFIGTLAFICFITAGMLIFCDAGTNKIETMNTDGTGRKVIFQDAGAHFYGLDVDSTYIYFSDWNKEYVLICVQSDFRIL